MIRDLRRPGPIHGFWCATSDPAVIEHAARLSPDFLCLDAQHGIDVSQMTTHMFSTMELYDVPGMVRVAQNSPTDIGRALDLGAAGVMVPMVDTANDAERAVAACRYAPSGNRSFGIRTPRLSAVDPEYRPVCAIQIETARGVANAEAIAAVDGVEWLYIGPADLGLSVGGVPAPDVVSVFDGSHPISDEMRSAFDAVVSGALAHDKLAGLHTSSGLATRIAEQHGFQVSCVSTDLAEMKSGMAEQLATARGETQ